MADEENQPSLRERITAAVDAHCQQEGLGFPIGFVYLVAHITSDGEKVMTIGSQEDQMTALSLGLSQYLSERYKAESWAELQENGFFG